MPGARFCRSCGAPLMTGSAREADAPVSPLAQTIPLTGEGRATDGLTSEEARRAAADTSRVGRTEMENFLRRTPPAIVPDVQTNDTDGDGDKSASQTTTLVLENSTPASDLALPPPASGTPATVAASASVQPSTTVRARRMWQVLAVVLLCVALVAGLLAFILSRRASSTDAEGASPISISDQKQLVSEKLSEADALLDSGEFNRAITVLRAAIKLDPSSTEAHMRLGSVLEKTGARGEAIEEYNAATESNPNDVSARRALASAQFEEKLYTEAAESYRLLMETIGESGVDDETRLAYADALRLAGQTDEARLAYQKISASAPDAVLQATRQHLVELGPPAVANNTERPRDVENNRDGQQTDTPEVATTTASPTPLASTTPVAASATAQSDADAYYFKAVNLVNGRDPKKLTDGELTAALNYFLRAQQSGAYGAEARRNAERLGREYDRRRKR
jgi:tetratricopeptide (TPR) repeat protein